MARGYGPVGNYEAVGSYVAVGSHGTVGSYDAAGSYGPYVVMALQVAKPQSMRRGVMKHDDKKNETWRPQKRNLATKKKKLGEIHETPTLLRTSASAP